MLYQDRPRSGPAASLFGDTSAGVRVDVHHLFNILWVRRALILKSVLAFALAAAVYAVLRPPSYTASTQLFIYNTKLAFLREDAVYPETQLDPSFLESQMDILKSEKIAADVMHRLGMDVEDRKAPSGIFNLFSSRSTNQSDSQAAAEARQRDALKRFQRRLSVQRVGLGYVVAVSFTDPDAGLAARVANATADAYIEDQNAARLEMAQAASAWLRERIKELGPRTRIVARASRPIEKSGLAGRAVVGLGALAGLAFSVVFVFGRELLDRRIRGPEQATMATGTECLGVVPLLALKGHRRRVRAEPKRRRVGLALRKVRARFVERCREMGLLATARVMWLLGRLAPDHKMIADFRKDIGDPHLQSNTGHEHRWGQTARRRDDVKSAEIKESRKLNDADPALSYVLDHPSSQTWNALRHVQVALDISRSARAERTVGVTSTVEGEGTTTIAANLARLTANAGSRTLLVDCNYQNPRLSNVFSPDAVSGLVDMLDRGDCALSDLLWVDPRTGMHFLPIGGQDNRQQKSQLIWSSLMPRLMGQLDQAYDYVIFDLPPVSPMADVRAASELLDRVLLVIQWGKITVEHLQAGLAAGGSLPLKLLGSVLNKAELAAVSRLSSPRASLLSQRVDAEASAPPITSPLRRPSPLEQANTER